MNDKIWGLAVEDHDGTHYEWMFTSRELAQEVADKLNPHRPRHYQLAPVPIALVESAADPRVQVEAIESWMRID